MSRHKVSLDNGRVTVSLIPEAGRRQTSVSLRMLSLNAEFVERMKTCSTKLTFHQPIVNGRIERTKFLTDVLNIKAKISNLTTYVSNVTAMFGHLATNTYSYRTLIDI